MRLATPAASISTSFGGATGLDFGYHETTASGFKDNAVGRYTGTVFFAKGCRERYGPDGCRFTKDAS